VCSKSATGFTEFRADYDTGSANDQHFGRNSGSFLRIIRRIGLEPNYYNRNDVPLMVLFISGKEKLPQARAVHY
jgi:hypothetical protein